MLMVCNTTRKNPVANFQFIFSIFYVNFTVRLFAIADAFVHEVMFQIFFSCPRYLVFPRPSSSLYYWKYFTYSGMQTCLI